MRHTRRITRTAAWVAAGVLGAGALSGVAYAATDHPAARQQQPGASGRGTDRGGGGLLRALEHGELTLRARGGDRTVDLQRGTLTAVGPTSVTVTSQDGFAATYAVTAQTRVRGGVGSLRQGEPVLVVSSGGQALRVVVARGGARTARPPAPGAAPSTSA